MSFVLLNESSGSRIPETMLEVHKRRSSRGIGKHLLAGWPTTS